MKYPTTRFGDIDLQPGDILHFPEGIYGFETEKQFVLLPFDPNVECPLHWLQSLKTPDLAFVITNPFLYKQDYSVQMNPEERKKIHLRDDDTISVWVIVKIPEDFTRMTANLVAPLVVNNRENICMQFVMTTPDYDTRHYLLPKEVREASAAV